MPQDSQRVVWHEGMTLDPHHFQQWDRHRRRALDARSSMTSRYDRGVATLDIDQERLTNGELAVRSCSGLMPDGLPFDIPDHDAAPAPRNVEDAFEATAETIPVFLTIPADRPQGGNVLRQGDDNRRETRFIAETASVPDENTGSDERRVEVAQANVQLRFGGEPLEAYTALPIARITREAGGTFALDDDFIPPCLRIGASNVLMTIARRLLERLTAKSDELTERQRNASAQRELSPGDVTAMGLLGAVNTFIPVLNHHYTAQSHPEALYATLLALAGQLSAYLPEADVQPRRFPEYDHSDLAACFHPLDQTLRDMLGGAKPAANYVQLDLQQKRENLYVSSAAPELLKSGQFFVVARAPGRVEEKLIETVPRKLRVASPDDIEKVIRSYTRALPIEHTHRLPVGMPVDDQASYFRLQQRGPFWEAIEEATEIALFIPSDVEDVDLELVAVKQD